MLFNSIEYLLFLPIVFLLYWFVFKPVRLQNLFIVAASYLFYGWWDWRFLLLIAFTTMCSYLSGILIEKFNNRGGASKMIVSLNIIINLLILGVYKYYDFFVLSLCEVFRSIGVTLDFATLNLVLPVGISFYTFQALSYSIDVYRKKMQASKDVVSFFAFISFFPQLVAGPIERATNLLPQFQRERRFDYCMAVDGMRQILWGLFKKMVIADNCAIIVNDVFAEYDTAGSCRLWIGAIFFAFQIYGDFSGYSDIAIGSAKLFGIKLTRNFNFPYLSRNIAEFWRRWHISLNTWFVDYVYIPLGGSRKGKWLTMVNMLVVFIVSGLWHGANWTFIVWGLYHAILFLPLVMFGTNKKYRDTAGAGHRWPTVKELYQIALTFLLVVIGWVIFRSETIGEAYEYIVRMFTAGFGTIPRSGMTVSFFVMALVVVEWIKRNKEHAFDFNNTGLMKYRGVRLSFYYVLFLAILLFSGNKVEFIYFQF